MTTRATRYTWDDMAEYYNKFADVKEFVSNQRKLPMHYPRIPRGKMLKYIVLDSTGHSDFPTGLYNKCGKYKRRKYKVGTTEYESLEQYQATREVDLAPVEDNECEYTSYLTSEDEDKDGEDNVPLSQFVTPSRSRPTTSRASPTINIDSPIQPTDLDFPRYSRYDNTESYVHSTLTNSPPTNSSPTNSPPKDQLRKLDNPKVLK